MERPHEGVHRACRVVLDRRRETLCLGAESPITRTPTPRRGLSRLSAPVLGRSRPDKVQPTCVTSCATGAGLPGGGLLRGAGSSAWGILNCRGRETGGQEPVTGSAPVAGGVAPIACRVLTYPGASPSPQGPRGPIASHVSRGGPLHYICVHVQAVRRSAAAADEHVNSHKCAARRAMCI